MVGTSPFNGRLTTDHGIRFCTYAGINVIARIEAISDITIAGLSTLCTTSTSTPDFVKGYSMPAIGHRNVTVAQRVLAGVDYLSEHLGLIRHRDERFVSEFLRAHRFARSQRMIARHQHDEWLLADNLVRESVSGLGSHERHV
jgi:hypothetical protein